MTSSDQIFVAIAYKVITNAYLIYIQRSESYLKQQIKTQITILLSTAIGIQTTVHLKPICYDPSSQSDQVQFRFDTVQQVWVAKLPMDRTAPHPLLHLSTSLPTYRYRQP